MNFNKLKSTIRDVKFGENCTVMEPSNLYECELGNNIFIGPFVEITKGVKIGNNTRVSSHSFICEMVTIGENCFIAHGVMFTNDLFKNGKIINDSSRWFKTNIGDNVVIGSNSTILPVNISSNIVIGAGSVVTKNLEVSGTYAGNPAKLIRKFNS
jgi:acetyltransferase-like isoleucine patch superfamily enzyme